ncbi:MAG: MarR family transcriptional regulator [Ilumatobacter sp.]|uniref:MarR family winged helix-turn-helix transcriptional regulator n=1 Tax=Ilumatobacter sp. TaxID=1967498 RepID=UPI00262A64B7|nr:MarR family transcriptional regulator [Ilumatobacter sp.]MDJ0770807.1 MarR family transcriptional regulator [Ilumatobacter sp.]
MSARTAWLDDTEMAGWRAFIETQVDLMGALEADLATHDLTLGDYQVLVYLSEVDGHALRMCDLADMLQLSPSGLTRRLDGLVRASWVERRGSEADRRVMMAVLTDAGRRHLVEAAPTHVDSVRRHIFDHLDRADVEALASIFGKIRAALDDRASTPA